MAGRRLASGRVDPNVKGVCQGRASGAGAGTASPEQLVLVDPRG